MKEPNLSARLIQISEVQKSNMGWSKLLKKDLEIVKNSILYICILIVLDYG